MGYDDKEALLAGFQRARNAIAHGNEGELAGLLVEYLPIVKLADHSDSYGEDYTLLHYAAGHETLRHEKTEACTDMLLQAGADVNVALPGGATPLHFAASLNHCAVAARLLESGASVTVEDGGEGGTPLVHALFYGCRDTADLLADVATVPGTLRVAAGIGRPDLISACFNADGSLTAAARGSRTFYRPHDEFPEWHTEDCQQEVIDEAFVYACVNGRLPVLALLLDRGANVNARPYFATGLHHAAWNGHREVVDFLMDHGADCAVMDSHYGGEPWGWAFFGGHPEIRKDILNRAADFNGSSIEGTPLDVAIREENDQAVGILTAMGCRSSEDLGDYPHATPDES